MKAGFNRVSFLVKGPSFSDPVLPIYQEEEKKRVRSPDSQPIIFEQKQKPDHEPFHQDSINKVNVTSGE
jgi:hypothetical protein